MKATRTDRVRFWLVELMKDSSKSWDIPLYLTPRWSFIRFESGHKIAKFTSREEADAALSDYHLAGAPKYKLRVRCMEIATDGRMYRWVNTPEVSVKIVGQRYYEYDPGDPVF